MAVALIGILSGTLVTNARDFTSANRSHPSSQDSDPANQDALPDSVKVTGQGEKVLLDVHTTEGYQIYECQASTTDPSGFAWTFQAPFAILSADDGTNVIHSTGPLWLYTQDGSKVEGKVGQFTAPDGKVVPASATPNADAIPWLRLDVTNHLGNTGLFSQVDQIQRLHTEGGKAPNRVCNSETANKHVIVSVPYQAEYVFWGH
jgi:hypothetical protein